MCERRAYASASSNSYQFTCVVDSVLEDVFIDRESLFEGVLRGCVRRCVGRCVEGEIK